jgi:hypothetical protein
MGGGSNWNKEKLFKFGEIGKQIRGNYALVPLVFTISVGAGICAFHCARNVYRSPDIMVNRRGNPHPYARLEKDGELVQYKYFSTLNYKQLKPDPDRPVLD